MSDVQHEAYRPLIEDGRGIFPEDFRLRRREGSATRCALLLNGSTCRWRNTNTKLQGPPANDPARPWLTEDDEIES